MSADWLNAAWMALGLLTGFTLGRWPTYSRRSAELSAQKARIESVARWSRWVRRELLKMQPPPWTDEHRLHAYGLFLEAVERDAGLAPPGDDR